MRKLRTWAKLGFRNILQVAAYRLLLKAGLHSAQRLKAQIPMGPLFRAPAKLTEHPEPVDLPWIKNPLYFGGQNAPAPATQPNWLCNPFAPEKCAPAHLPWWKISDFAAEQGDIKYIWEASRFEWAVNFALLSSTGERQYLEKLNDWCAEWWRHNPPYFGPNWKCAQETSIRIIRLCLCADILGQFRDSQTALVDTIAIHLARVKPTLSYAQAQENNHATSEAAALIIGGVLLRVNQHPKASSFIQLGLAALEKALAQLIMDDGSFSQNSTNYHRLMLDTCCIAKIICDKYEGPQLSKPALTKLEKAIDWLSAMTDPVSGHAFNLGHNDSAYLLPYPSGKMRDFRMTIGLAQSLFLRRIDGENAQAAKPFFGYLNIECSTEQKSEMHGRVFEDGGYCLLNHQSTRVLMRLPKYRFRPAHCDGLHVDVYVNGENVLRDSGTISYISNDPEIDLARTCHHNTVQFDDDEQMPRLSRFLWGDWLEPSQPTEFQNTDGGGIMASAYQTHKKHIHKRQVQLDNNKVLITDTIKGIFIGATLRWHLAPGNWVETLPGNFENGKINLRITSSTPLKFNLTEANQGLSYGVASTIPLIEATCGVAALITTQLSW